MYQEKGFCVCRILANLVGHPAVNMIKESKFIKVGDKSLINLSLDRLT